MSIEDHGDVTAPQQHRSDLMASDFWAGYLSGAIGIIIGNPLDVIKVRLQAGHSSADAAAAAASQQRLSRFELARGLINTPAYI